MGHGPVSQGGRDCHYEMPRPGLCLGASWKGREAGSPEQTGVTDARVQWVLSGWSPTQCWHCRGGL